MILIRQIFFWFIVLITAIFFLSYGVVFSQGQEDEDWPMFMKDPIRSSSSTPSITPPLSLKWKFTTGGSIYSSPVVSNGKVFIGSYDGNLYAVDIKTGKKVWSFKTGAEILSTPVVNGGSVYFGSKDGFIYAVDSEKGDPLWKFETKGKITSSPVVALNSIFIGSGDTQLYALDIKTGKRKWKRSLKDYKYSGIYSNPVYKEGMVYIASKNMMVYAYESHEKSAKKKWSFLTGAPVYSSPVIVDSTLYIGSFDNNLYALDLNEVSDDDEPDDEPKVKWKVDLGGWVYASPVVNKGKIYIGTKKGLFLALRESDGSVLWKIKLDCSISSTMAIAANKIGFVGCDDGKLYAINLIFRDVIWSFPTLGGVHSSPAIAQGMVFFGSKDGNLYALGK